MNGRVVWRRSAQQAIDCTLPTDCDECLANGAAARAAARGRRCVVCFVVSVSPARARARVSSTDRRRWLIDRVASGGCVWCDCRCGRAASADTDCRTTRSRPTLLGRSTSADGQSTKRARARARTVQHRCAGACRRRRRHTHIHTYATVATANRSYCGDCAADRRRLGLQVPRPRDASFARDQRRSRSPARSLARRTNHRA